jgi:GT2 family glycosyltransferase
MTTGPHRPLRIRAVVPSLAGTPDRLSRLSEALRAAGAEPVVVPTGASVEDALRGSDVDVLPIGANPGFAATIAHGAQGAWDWLLVVNDDVTVEADRLSAALDALEHHGPEARVLSFLDPVPPKPVPSRTDALLGLSLVGPVLRHLGLLRSPLEVPHGRGTYRPFSFVAVSRTLWDELGGLDQRFIYTFEDADFTRRAHATGATVAFPDDTGVSHLKYGTSTSRIRSVLPCAAYSTAAYLEVLGMGPRRARAACVAALMVRVPLVAVGGLPRREHLAGIGGALRSFLDGRRPSLPDYATN